MQPRIVRNSFLITVALTALLLMFSPAVLGAEPNQSNVLIRDNFTAKNRSELIHKLRTITGWSTLDFDSGGALRVGPGEIKGGSESARSLITRAMSGPNMIVLEATRNDLAIVFCQLTPGKWKRSFASNPPAYVVRIDFADFEKVLGDRRAREAFDVGWGVLHELDHVVNDSDDSSIGTLGDCEINVNAMRRELGLAERAEYHFSFLTPASAADYKSRFVKMAFQHRDTETNKTRRYWLFWDAAVVGGLPGTKQLASNR